MQVEKSIVLRMDTDEVEALNRILCVFSDVIRNELRRIEFAPNNPELNGMLLRCGINNQKEASAHDNFCQVLRTQL